MHNAPDSTTDHEAATKLVDRINAYWAARGRCANARIVEAGLGFNARLRTATMYTVQSDCVNGMAPPVGHVRLASPAPRSPSMRFARLSRID